MKRDYQKAKLTLIEEQKKLEMMREHPEWFEVTSPKEYGMKLKKRKHGRR